MNYLLNLTSAVGVASTPKPLHSQQAVMLELGGGVRAGGGFFLNGLAITVDYAAGSVKELMTGAEYEIEVGEVGEV